MVTRPQLNLTSYIWFIAAVRTFGKKSRWETVQLAQLFHPEGKEYRSSTRTKKTQGQKLFKIVVFTPYVFILILRIEVCVCVYITWSDSAFLLPVWRLPGLINLHLKIIIYLLNHPQIQTYSQYGSTTYSWHCVFQCQFLAVIQSDCLIPAGKMCVYPT